VRSGGNAPETDPAAVSSVVQAIEKALVVLVHARQGEVIVEPITWPRSRPGCSSPAAS
jgi:dTDP-4-amino-4,6-dideoxygalactose transaminase